MHVSQQLPPDEEKLFRLLCEGDKEAFDQIYNLYWKRLFLYVVKVIKDSEAAEDIVQEIFVSLWLRRQEITEQRTLSGYLFTAARFKGINYVQDQLKKGKHADSLINHFNASQDGLDDLMEAKELNLIINKEIEKLPPKMRDVFVLSRRDQLSHKEISEKLQISDKTVKKQINNALKHFKLVLSRDAILCVGLVIHWAIFL
ncbi:RNA polymerase sigma-70 factor [Mucilaginibacter galii]|uniref:DNA-directed RNA polymerase sigma-70 factor n=1 Tax=Mucilaginibacter galii TaxID=2005073 RepID=A0A917N1A6_9SPHI|nr:RNA polymerase sigma-70 factor [Mucilaginibacter galii]GGI50643.1 DNA-directed RNA polymerase sigma-70 factor [Mucilaginibacter galii]